MSRGKLWAVIGLLAVVIGAGIVLTHVGDRPPGRDAATGNPGAAIDDGVQDDRIQTAQLAAGNAGAARIFDIDSDGSEVYWRIYKAGLMARFGHNHVISAGRLDGSIALGDDPAAAEWSLRIRYADLVVDDAQIRARHGEDFESMPSDNDIEGTTTNMLTEDVLNGDAYSEIRLSGTGFSGTLTDAELPVTIEMLGRAIDVVLPGSIVIDGDTLTVSGEFRLMHKDLGMEPFSAAAGALRVGDEIDFTYRIRAVAGGR